MLSASGVVATCASRPVARSIAKLDAGKSSLRNAAKMKRRSGVTAIGMLAGDGLSVPGTATLSIIVSSPLSRFIAKTPISLLPAFDT